MFLFKEKSNDWIFWNILNCDEKMKKIIFSYSIICLPKIIDTENLNKRILKKLYLLKVIDHN